MGKCKTKAIQTDLGTFRHNQAYSETCVNLAYSEPWYIQNPDIFKTRNICRTLVHSEPGILKTLAYSKLKAYSDIYDVKHYEEAFCKNS